MTQELGIIALIKRGVRVLTSNGDDLTDSSDPSRKMMRQMSVFKCFGTISGIWKEGSGSFGLEFRRLSTDVAIVAV